MTSRPAATWWDRAVATWRNRDDSRWWPFLRAYNFDNVFSGRVMFLSFCAAALVSTPFSFLWAPLGAVIFLVVWVGLWFRSGLMAPVHCPHCGKRVKLGYDRCHHCGQQTV